MNQITPCTSDRHFAQFGEVITDFFAWLRQRYAANPSLIDEIAGAQSLDAELRVLSSAYAPPAGRAFLVSVDGAVAGCGAWRKLADGSCEMKRVFVRDGFQGRGAGRDLCTAILGSARSDGYTTMRLDSLKALTEAYALYTSVGFSLRTPYIDYPPHILAELNFMEAALAAN